MNKVLRLVTALTINLIALALTATGQEVKYDRFEDTSKVTGEQIKIDNARTYLVVYGKALIKGDASNRNFEINSVQAIYLSFFSDLNKDFVFRFDHKVKAIIDDERFDFPLVEWTGGLVDINNVGVGRPIIVARERVDIKIALNELKKVTTGKSVEFRIGTIEVSLTTKVQDELKKLIRFLETSKQ